MTEEEARKIVEKLQEIIETRLIGVCKEHWRVLSDSEAIW